MSRYFDANAFIKELMNLGVRLPIKKVAIAINKTPTIDVRREIHGKNISKSGFLCSVCKFGDFDGFHGYEPNFCPNCGADMRGGADDI